MIEKLIWLAKQNTLSAKREAFRILKDHHLVSRLFAEIGPRFAQVSSGFIRIIPVARRRGDNAKIVIFELTLKKEKKPKRQKKQKESTPAPEQEVTKGTPTPEAKPLSEKKPEATVAVKEKPPITKKPSKKFLGGLRQIFKKERDSL
jgi:large subunit ribosomal protein L17